MRLGAALGELGAQAEGFVVDARDDADLAGLFGEIGPVDHLVVTVTGPSGTTPFRELTREHLQSHVSGKLLPHIAVVQAALPHLTPGASITLVSAASAGTTPGPKSSPILPRARRSAGWVRPTISRRRSNS
ncbi:hypothetical protein ABZV91_04310 [Nocardia sp. NPDC004568]|uniref:hypothetical protein n=1 Tax=Nocardia sp. NPDC004568 TaxID=3154551 RepID=UPI0033A513F1